MDILWDVVTAKLPRLLNQLDSIVRTQEWQNEILSANAMKRRLVNLVAPAPEWLKAVQADAKSKGLATLTMRKVDRVIADTRSEAREHVGKPDRRAKR